MATLTLTRAAAQPSTRRHPSAKIVTEDGVKLVLPFAPVETTHDGFAPTYATLDRPGRKPITVEASDGLRSCTFSVFLGYRSRQRSVEPLLNTLDRIARSGDRVTLVGMGGLEGRVKWNLTGVNVQVIARQHGTNAATRANAALTFTEDVDPVVNVGPLSGGKKNKNKNKNGKGASSKNSGKRGGKGSSSQTRRYTVRQGDTLAAIALKFYGDPNKWRPIAKASGVRDPRKLKVGTRLTIPPEK